MTTQEIVRRLRAGEYVGYVPLGQMYEVANAIGADTSLARCLRGTGSQSDALIEAIEAKLKAEGVTFSTVKA